MLPPRRYKQRDSYGEIHRKWLRTFQCCCWGNSVSPCDIDHSTELAHYRSAANSGTGMKPGPEWLIPLCRTHHHEQHQHGQKAFEQTYGLSMSDLAREFANQSPESAVREAAKTMLKEPR